LDESEKAYVAALLDGEGSISIYEHTNYPRLSVSIYNTNKEVIDYLSEILDYHIDRGVDNRERSRQNKDCYVMMIRRQEESLDFLKHVKPYLVTKKEQAELGIDFMEEVIYRDSHKYTDEKIEKLYSLKEKMGELNNGYE